MSTIRCLACRRTLARVRVDNVRPSAAARPRWDGAGVMILTCPACGQERRVTVGEDREAA